MTTRPHPDLPLRGRPSTHSPCLIEDSLFGNILLLKWKICSLELLSSPAPFPSGKEVEEGAYVLFGPRHVEPGILVCMRKVFQRDISGSLIPEMSRLLLRQVDSSNNSLDQRNTVSHRGFVSLWFKR